jgi:hypothetical protein
MISCYVSLCLMKTWTEAEDRHGGQERSASSYSYRPLLLCFYPCYIYDDSVLCYRQAKNLIWGLFPPFIMFPSAWFGFLEVFFFVWLRKPLRVVATLNSPLYIYPCVIHD